MNMFLFFNYKNTLTSLSFWSKLYQYKFHDVAIEELQKIHRIFPDMIPSSGTYSELFWRTNSVPFYIDALLTWVLLLLISAFTDSTQKDLLKLIGNLAVQYGGRCELLTLETVHGDYCALMTAPLS